MIRSAVLRAAVVILLAAPCALGAQVKQEEPNLRKIADDTKFQNALTFISLKKYDRALVELAEYLEVFVNGSHRREAYARTGDIHFERFDYRLAIRAYRTLSEEFSGSPEGIEALYRIGLCYRKMGRTAKALALFKRIIAEHPDSDAALQAKNQLDILDIIEKDNASAKNEESAVKKP
ncbi:MAG TPA: tetratricopeptide repeat protein [Spirochaetota bacterium]|nr:tetratricopeptide repeat protein [Spirochaetota bacterium]HNT11555.1 tetratricopeptide repeat protein [Spirochaetota bacterium]